MNNFKVFYEVPLKEGVLDIMIDVVAPEASSAKDIALKQIKEIVKSNRLVKEAQFISVKQEVTNGTK
jgi:hypothetical protein